MFNTIPNNPFPPSSANAGAGGGGSYVLPVASADTLGGVKVGDNLSIDDGVLSAPAPYTPPAYSTNEVNTGVKWIDGRDIYRKVYANIQLSNSTDVTVDANFGADKNVIRTFAVANSIESEVRYQSPLGGYSSSSDIAYPRVYGDALKIVVHDNWSTYTAHLIVEYTKTPTP